jgi:tetratricopeptide (TPR) repeat protein
MSSACDPLTELLHEAVRHLNGGDWPLASSRLKQILALEPSHAVAAYLLGVGEFRRGHWSEAEHLFRKALRTDSAPPGVSLHLSCALQSQGRFAESEQVLRAMGSDGLNPAEQAAWCHRMGLALKHQRRHAEALEFLQRARVAAPQDRDVALDLAVLLQHLCSYEAAMGVFEQLVDRDPLDLDAHLQLNELLYRQGRDDAFLRSYERAAARTRPATPLLNAKGRFLLKAQRAGEALTAFVQALTVQPSDAGAMAGRGRALEALGETAGARTAHESSVSANPDTPDSLIDAAAFLLRQQQADRAKGLLVKAMTLRPANQAALSLLCLCHRALGEEREESWLAGYENLVAYYDLPAPEGYGSMLDFNRDLAAYLEPLHDDKREHFTQTLRGGTRLFDEVFNNGHALVERLRPRIDAAVAHHVGNLPVDERHPFLSRRASDFRYVSSWSSRLVDRGFHLNHVHPQGWISSAYYVSVPEVCRDERRRQGWLKLGEPTGDFGPGFPPRRYIQPAPGRLVLFPSYLWHGTVPFESDQVRITIAFDVAPLAPSA